MFDVNVKILSELKNFITVVSSNRELLGKFCSSDKDFSRSRKLPFDKLAFFIIKLCKKTLSVELERYFEELNNSMPCSVSAFTQQRCKLHFSFFYWWNAVLYRSYYFYSSNQVKRWNEYRLIAADGSNINLINSAALSKHFGGQSNQNSFYTLAKTFYHYDVLNELILVPQIKPYRYGEMQMAFDAIDNSVSAEFPAYNPSKYKSFSGSPDAKGIYAYAKPGFPVMRNSGKLTMLTAELRQAFIIHLLCIYLLIAFQ